LRLLLEYTTVQVILFSLLCLGRVFATVRCKPYISKTVNTEEVVLAGLCLVIVFCGVVLYAITDTEAGSSGHGVPIALRVILFVIVLLCLIAMVCAVFHYSRLALQSFRSKQAQFSQKHAQDVDMMDDDQEMPYQGDVALEDLDVDDADAAHPDETDPSLSTQHDYVEFDALQSTSTRDP